MLKTLMATLAVLALTAAPASAEVVEEGADHFAIRHAVALEASPEDFIDALENIGSWWNSDHTYSGDAGNLSLALDPGTCFCEAMPDGSAFEHGAVYEYDPATGVLIRAALGPLKDRAAQADWSIGWTGANRGYELVMTYVVRGPGLGEMSGPVDAMLGEQFRRMVRFIEYGEVVDDPESKLRRPGYRRPRARGGA